MNTSLKPKTKDTLKTIKNTVKTKPKSVVCSALPRSDMAAELLGNVSADFNFDKIVKNKIKVDKILAKKIGKPEGVYITLESGIIKSGLKDKYAELSQALAQAVHELTGHLSQIKNVLIVCLGNPNLTADALGAKVFDNLVITRHLPKELSGEISISALCPNVMGATGIESFDIIKGVVEKISPQLVIAVDSLASAAVARIASAFQLCSSGITPGSGVANHRMRLDKSSLGVEVLSVGVPLVVYATTIIAEAAGGSAAQNADEEIQSLIVTPKDIDFLVEECAKVIAAGINKSFIS